MVVVVNILMMTNTYAPHVGGVARSVTASADEYRRRGHQVLVVAPTFEGAQQSEPGVVRVPAIQNFNGSDFSVAATLPRRAAREIDRFRPDLVHSHHPFLLGGAALRAARRAAVPLVFTHHTRYEHYTHYVPGNSKGLRRFVVHLSVNYANLSDHVFAPSQSLADILRERGVRAAVTVVPTGVRLEDFGRGTGLGLRRILGIPDGAFVAGHVGRLAPEKNLAFLTEALVRLLAVHPGHHVLVGGDGPYQYDMEARFRAAGCADRVRFTGTLHGRILSSAYEAMDVFTFASQSETQGMVLVEAMAAGAPVVALAAPGASDVVVSGRNGHLLPAGAGPTEFAQTVAAMAERSAGERASMESACRTTAREFSRAACADKALAVYAELLARGAVQPRGADDVWRQTLRLIRGQWELISGTVDAASGAIERRGGG